MAKAVRAIDRVTKAYAGKRKKTVIGEWGGLEVWASPLTTQDRIDANDQIRLRYGKEEEDWPAHVAGVFLLIQKLEDKSGERLFEFTDAPDLLQKAEALVVDRVLVWIYGGLTAVEAGKESATTSAESDSTASSENSSESP